MKRRAGLPVRLGSEPQPVKLGLDLGDEPIVARQPEQKVHAVRLAPSHQLLAREAAVGAHQNAHKRPTAANVGDDARDLLHRSPRGVDVGAPQLGGQQMAPAEHVERQVAVAVVIAMEEPPLLLAMHGIVGRIEIKDDLASALARAPPGTESTSSRSMAAGLWLIL